MPAYLMSHQSLSFLRWTPVGSRLPCGRGIGPLSTPLPNGFRFLQPPYPAYLSGRLTTPSPSGQIYGVSKFRSSSNIGLGACSQPGDCGIEPLIRDVTR